MYLDLCFLFCFLHCLFNLFTLQNMGWKNEHVRSINNECGLPSTSKPKRDQLLNNIIISHLKIYMTFILGIDKIRSRSEWTMHKWPWSWGLQDSRSKFITSNQCGVDRCWGQSQSFKFNVFSKSNGKAAPCESKLSAMPSMVIRQYKVGNITM